MQEFSPLHKHNLGTLWQNNQNKFGFFISDIWSKNSWSDFFEKFKIQPHFEWTISCMTNFPYEHEKL